MAKVPVFRISVTNATLLSGVYLVVGALVEVSRRTFNPRWAERLSLSLEAFPARVLEFLGLFEPVRKAWLEGRLGDLEVRLIYGLTTVLLIYSLGLVVGSLMWAVAKLAARGEAEEG